MIGYIEGKVLRNDGKALLVFVQGVGYEITVTASMAASIVVGDTIELYTYLHVREDDLSLYGFPDTETLTFFKQLLMVSGVGPKMGIEIISGPIQRIQQAIIEEDKTYLTSIKGVGDKLASRLLLELKNKVKIDFIPEKHTTTIIPDDVVQALENLGYDRTSIMRLLQNIPHKQMSEEDMIRYCLRHL